MTNFDILKIMVLAVLVAPTEVLVMALVMLWAIRWHARKDLGLTPPPR